MRKEVFGPLTIKEFVTIMLSSAFAYGFYLYFGYSFIFVIVVSVLVVSGLFYMKYGQ